MVKGGKLTQLANQVSCCGKNGCPFSRHDPVGERFRTGTRKPVQGFIPWGETRYETVMKVVRALGVKLHADIASV
jgi:hypothetical protein